MTTLCITYDMGIRKRPKDPELIAEAHQGYLSWEYWERLQKAFHRYEEWLAALRGVDRAITPGKASKHKKTKSLGYVNLSGIYLAVDEIESYLRTYPEDLETWVKNKYTATDAVRFTLACERAFENHPIKETPHRLQRVRCPKCKHLTLIWMPAEHYLDVVKAICTTKDCGQEIPQTSFEKIAEIEERRHR